jgi:hypothetical protein
MPLQLLPLEEADFNILLRHADTGEVGDDLIAQPFPLAWPVSTRPEAQTRIWHSNALLKRRFLNDPTISFLKVVDEDNAGDIVAVARWHFYPHGYDYETEKHWELLPLPAADEADGGAEQGVVATYPPPNLNIDYFNHILTSRDLFRRRWIPEGKPCWILMNVVTRSSQRRRGAAGMLTRWGQEQAEKTGASAYLEAGVLGRPVYEKFGFQQAYELLRVDIKNFQAPVDVLEMVCMAWHPGGDKKAEVESVKELNSVKALVAEVEVPTSTSSV